MRYRIDMSNVIHQESGELIKHVVLYDTHTNRVANLNQGHLQGIFKIIEEIIPDEAQSIFMNKAIPEWPKDQH